MSEYITPPPGWYDFGTHIDPLKPGEALVFHHETDTDGFPRWERVETLTQEDYIAMYVVVQESKLTRAQKFWLLTQMSRGRENV